MIQSKSQSPDNGISSGIVSTCGVVALTVGANTGLKRKPAKFDRKKREIMANDANLAKRKLWTRAKRKRGNCWGNFIVILHVSDGPGPSGLKLKTSGCAWWNQFQRTCNALEMETVTKMEIWLRKLLFDCFYNPSM